VKSLKISFSESFLISVKLSEQEVADITAKICTAAPTDWISIHCRSGEDLTFRIQDVRLIETK
jgi:hypothetical protein